MAVRSDRRRYFSFVCVVKVLLIDPHMVDVVVASCKRLQVLRAERSME